MALARSEGSSPRFYSMSAQIRVERKTYYSVPGGIQNQTPQNQSMDVTPWVDWFLSCLGRAIEGAQDVLASVLNKAKFWESVRHIPLNDRQRLILNRLMNGFEGKLTTDKYAKIARCSQDTAYRDILSLVYEGILVRDAEKGRSTSYSLVMRDSDSHDRVPPRKTRRYIPAVLQRPSEDSLTTVAVAPSFWGSSFNLLRAAITRLSSHTSFP